jgi:hypothetical protein
MTPSKGIQKMATFEDLILTNKVLGPEYKAVWMKARAGCCAANSKSGLA